MKTRQFQLVVNAFGAPRTSRLSLFARKPSFRPPFYPDLRHHSSSPQARGPSEGIDQQTGVTLSYLHLLPRACPGCGALTHNNPANKAGYYGRKSIRKVAHRLPTADKVSGNAESTEAPEVPQITDALRKAEENEANEASVDVIRPDLPGPLASARCDRCNDLANESLGESILHPAIDSIAAIIGESPFKQNHVYHVVDAVDFPASIIPNIFNKLELVKQRSQNRRAKSTMFKGGRTTTVSFIITRSDILFPSEEQVNTLMPWFIKNLRSALGRHNERARMGNVHLVSSKRGWWTKELKEDIRRRGGANWMVGKANVGKSNLFEVLYPKGSSEAELDYRLLREEANLDFDETSLALMPPPQPLVPYPTLPLVSPLPGTTASPIRLPFVASNGKQGELIDLPGLFRTPLENFVKGGHQTSLVMTKRPKPERITIKSTESLLIGGGLVRISPYAENSRSVYPSENVVYLMHPFLPSTVPRHKTSTTKAIGVQDGTLELGIGSITSPDAYPEMRSAGIFTLDKDVTKTHAARVLKGESRKDKRRVENLPFRIYATDLVIEGVGWVEITCQVRLPKSYPKQISEFETENSIPPNVFEGPATQQSNNTKEMETSTQTSDTTSTPVPGHRISHSPIQTSSSSSSSSTNRIPFSYDSPSPYSSLPIFDLDFPKPQIEVFTPLGMGVTSRETVSIYNSIMEHSRQKKKGPERNFSRKNRAKGNM